MTTERALRAMARALEARGRPFALAVSVRAEVRFTRDVELAIAIDDDTAVDRLVRDLAADGFLPVAIVEHEKARRISTVRLRGRDGVVVDLLCASTGIEELGELFSPGGCATKSSASCFRQAGAPRRARRAISGLAGLRERRVHWRDVHSAVRHVPGSDAGPRRARARARPGPPLGRTFAPSTRSPSCSATPPRS